MEQNKNIQYHFTSQITNKGKFYINKRVIKMENNDKLK